MNIFRGIYRICRYVCTTTLTYTWPCLICFAQFVPRLLFDICRLGMAMGRIPVYGIKCHGMPWHVLALHGMPWRAMPCDAIAWLAMPALARPWLQMSYHGSMTCHAKACHALPGYGMSCKNICTTRTQNVCRRKIII